MPFDDPYRPPWTARLLAIERAAVADGRRHTCGEWLDPTGMCLLCGSSVPDGAYYTVTPAGELTTRPCLPIAPPTRPQ